MTVSMAEVKRRAFHHSELERDSWAARWNGPGEYKWEEQWETEYERSDGEGKYGDYFNALGEKFTLNEDYKQLLGEKGGYNFTEEAAQKLEKLFIEYRKCIAGKEKRFNTEKRLVKQFMTTDQYNAVIAGDIQEIFRELMVCNEFVILGVETFAILFREAGKKEEEKNTIEYASKEFSYGKRLSIQKSGALMLQWSELIEGVNGTRQEIKSLSEKEIDIWISETNKEMEAVIDKEVKIYSQMRLTRAYEMEASVKEDYLIVDFMAEGKRKEEERIQEKCSKDKEINDLLREYNKYLDNKLKLEDIVARWIVGLPSNKEEAIAYIIKTSSFPINGNKKLFKKTIQDMKNLLGSMYERFKSICPEDMSSITSIYKEVFKGTRDKDLYVSSKEKCERILAEKKN